MTTSQQTDPMIDRLIDGRYRVRSRIARGGMATVYLATDERLQRRVAIKVMHGHLSDDQSFTNRFVQEARSAARLANPHVVSVFDQGQDNDMAYLVMEYLPGITLRDLLRDHGRLTAQQVVDIMDAVLTGLAAAHRAGIVHRDVKPENVLLADDGRIKISDFGLARAASANTATGQALLGTIAYLSPELVTRGIADTRSDIYALGIMMYEMLTGEQPYKGEQPMQIAYQHANDSVPRPSAKNPSVPDELDDLVLWATERNPDERPSTAQELLDRVHAVESALGFSPTVAPAPTTMLPASASMTTGDQPTRLLDDSLGRNTTDPLGAPAAPPMPSAPAVVDDGPTRLAKASKSRSRKGLWIAMIVVLLTALVGGTGWYFGSGPGSLIEIPVGLVEKPPAEVKTALTKLGFTIKEGQEYSLDIGKGLVSSTNPASGERVGRNSTITVNVSLGPKPVTIPKLAGLSLDDAKKALDAIGMSVSEDTVYQFSSEAAKDVVISASLSAGGADVSGGGNSFEGESVHFVVSVGSVPNVVGKSQSDAEAALEGADLTVAKTLEKFSDDVPKGNVMEIQYEKPLHPGDSVTLVISKGIDLVEVPDVAGMTINKAIQTLEDAGFKVKMDTDVPDSYWDIELPWTTVDSTDPSAGETIKRGSKVTVVAKLG